MAFEGEQPTAPLVVSAILTAPIWIPGFALYGAYHGIKAVIVHGVAPAIKKISGASKKEEGNSDGK
jgi:hypothetical protein